MKNRGEEYVLQSTVLRVQGRYDEAISIIEDNIDKIDPDVLVLAWLHAFNAAHAQGDRRRAAQFAKKVYELDPGVPSIQDYL